jgi:hypothetical protein
VADSTTRIVITGDSSSAVKAVERLKTEMGALSALSSRLFTGGFAGAAVVTGLVAMAKTAVDAADALNEMSERTGISVDNLGRLQYAAKLSGVESDVLAKSLQKLSVEIASAAGGSVESAAKFERFGISVRDSATKELRPANEVLLDLADAFALLPEGTERAARAQELFGKSGATLLPLLAGGREGVQALGDEIEKLGGLMTDDFAKSAAEFNDNLDRMKTVSSSVGIALGNAILPALNEVMQRFLDFKTLGLSFSDLIFGQNPEAGFKTGQENVTRTVALLADLRQQQATASAARQAEIAAEIAQQEKLLEFYRRMASRDGSAPAAEDPAKAAKRIALAAQLQTKLAELEKLRGIAAGKVSADILLSDEKLTDERIRNAQKLRDAWFKNWKEISAEAQKVAQEAKDLTDKAGETRAAGSDKAAEIRRGQLSEADQAFLNQRDATNFADTATVAALQAKSAAMYGRTENAAKLADQATKAAEQASKYADKIADPEDRARAVERIAEAQATAQEAQAKIKQQEAASLEATAEKTKTQLAEFDAQLAELQAKAAAIDVQVKTDEAIAAIAGIQTQLAALQDKTVTVTVNTVKGATGDFSLPGDSAGASGSFASGGYTGPGGKFQPAGIVHAGEFVTRAEILRQRGALDFLERFNRFGMSALPGFADGGLVGRLAIPTLRSPQPVTERMAATFNFPGLGSYRATVSADTFRQLQNDFQRAALQKGGRR